MLVFEISFELLEVKSRLELVKLSLEFSSIEGLVLSNSKLVLLVKSVELKHDKIS